MFIRLMEFSWSGWNLIYWCCPSCSISVRHRDIILLIKLNCTFLTLGDNDMLCNTASLVTTQKKPNFVLSIFWNIKAPVTPETNLPTTTRNPLEGKKRRTKKNQENPICNIKTQNLLENLSALQINTNAAIICFLQYTPHSSRSTFIRGLIVFSTADFFQVFAINPHQKDWVEAWLGLPLSELLLRRLQHSCVLTGGLS